jgi:hypothetical protein
MKHLTSPPDLSKLPAAYVTVVGKALAKNPAHRYASLAEMAKAVEAVGKEEPRPAPVQAQRPVAQAVPIPVVAPRRPPKPDPVPTVLPVPSLRGQVAELCGSLAMSAVLAAVATVLFAALGHGTLTPLELGQEFFLTVAACWAVLIPGKLWANWRGDAWGRRVVMMVLGMAIGLGTVWLNGWSPQLVRTDYTDGAVPGPAPVWGHSVPPVPEVAGYVAYFALAFFALRWWKLADRRRPRRFSLAPVLAAGFWSLALLLIWGDPWRGTLVLTTAAAIVQLVSPWEQPPPPVARRMRLRYA